jgi:arylsulfatase A-like enzyme
VNSDVTENIDLAPTFEQLGGATVPASVDGRSLVPLLHGEHPPWRTVALVEHHGPDRNPNDPDSQSFVDGNPPTYNAIRSPAYTYVRYANGQHEYYDLRTDPLENDNVYGNLSQARIAQLNATMNALVHCHGASSCWQAGQPVATTAP